MLIPHLQILLLESATLSVPWLFGGFHQHLALVLNVSAFTVNSRFLDLACYLPG